MAAVMPLVISGLVGLPTFRVPAAARASAVAVSVVVAAADFRGGGGGRRSDIRFKHDIVLLGHLPNGLGYYRFSYNGSDSAYVGVMAQEVQMVMPKAVIRDRDGSLRVLYERWASSSRPTRNGFAQVRKFQSWPMRHTS